jgi:hypothetical protein
MGIYQQKNVWLFVHAMSVRYVPNGVRCEIDSSSMFDLSLFSVRQSLNFSNTIALSSKTDMR